ncbi:hypothetical protein [Cryptosporangium sp. NPDC048952]|uniref:hypothetical protein n=1 Tax=Cryptosporangium sp. NPDC048952 TaxID=3363961 RepID=UPI00370FB25D
MADQVDDAVEQPSGERKLGMTPETRRRAWRMLGAGLAIGAFYALVSGQFIDAWQIWLSGKEVADAPLWGKTVLFWARAGKLLQFIAGLVVIIDLIGPEALRAHADRMKSRRLVWLTRFRAGVAGLRESFAEIALLIFLAAGMSAGWWVLGHTLIDNPETLKVVNAAAVAFFLISLPALVFLVYVFGTAIYSGSVGGLAWALDTKNPGHRVRWTGFWLFVLGFVLDLVGS